MVKINANALKFATVGVFFFILGLIFSKANRSVIQIPSSTPVVESASTGNTNEAPGATSLSEFYKVKRVIDGDTIEIEGGKKVRLIGIDTPELNKSNTAGCFGREAYDYLDKLINGKMVKMEKDVSETDRYGRLLRYLYLETDPSTNPGTSLFVNDHMVRSGYARVYTYPPDVKYQDLFKESEKNARDNNLGLWSKCIDTLKYSSASPQPENENAGKSTADNFVCDCSKSCSEISSCAEAQYQLKTCGCSKRDSDKDGIACDGSPLNCQN